jgi:Protein of unknown function (DUF4236)
MIRAMGWRFRRSVKIVPGLRLNVGKRSAGVSVGPRGAKVSVNTKGEVRRTVGAPGTGLSHTTQSRVRGRDVEGVALEELMVQDLDYLKRRRVRRLVGWGSAAVIVVLILAGAPLIAGYLIVPAVVLTIAAPWFARWL